ncbi:hypothetical protein HNR78_000528 [Parageobacillus toebii NBRC 107807]|uniref:Uncharacterized protein n=1 Tax=Parageobacillus toebii NBRC 107807 TaxID=1223503 RepID=A0AA89NNG6_9BACL|nr:hypothetical protein [Parageobacillus toebii NBRC 107807]
MKQIDYIDQWEQWEKSFTFFQKAFLGAMR